MSTPMYDLPEHQRVGLTIDGNGPADPPDPNFDHWGCWCGEADCTKAGCLHPRGDVFAAQLPDIAWRCPDCGETWMTKEER